MPATAARALSLGAPPVYVLAGGGAGPAAEVLTNADLVHAVLFASLEPPGGAARGLLSLQEAARLSTVHPAWRDAASRIPTRLDAPPAASLSFLAARPPVAAPPLLLSCTSSCGAGFSVPLPLPSDEGWWMWRR